MILIGNFLYTFHYQANQSVNTTLTLIVSYILIFRVLSIISFIISITDVLASLDSIFYRFLSIASKTVYYILFAIWMFLHVCAYIFIVEKYLDYLGFAQIISIVTIVSTVFISLGVVVLFQCFVVSKISHWINYHYRKRMMILIFILCISSFFMIICHYFLSASFFKYKHIMNNKTMKRIYFPMYFIYKYPVGLTLLAIISLISKPSYDELQNDNQSMEIFITLT